MKARKNGSTEIQDSLWMKLLFLNDVVNLKITNRQEHVCKKIKSCSIIGLDKNEFVIGITNFIK